MSDHDGQTTKTSVKSEFWIYARYLTVGAIAATADLVTYHVLTGHMEWHPLTANLVTRPMGGIISFTLNKFWTFRNRGKSKTSVQFAKFWTVWLITYAMSSTMVGVYDALLTLSDFWTKIAAEGSVGVLSYLMQRFWTFR